MFQQQASSDPAQQAVQGILQRIDALALKIGTTAQQIYAVYIHQAVVESIRDGFIALFGLVVLVISLYYAKSMWKKAKDDPYDETSYIAWGVVSTILAAAGAIIFLIFVYSAIGEALNPQYWAFQHLTSDLKGLL